MRLLSILTAALSLGNAAALVWIKSGDICAAIEDACTDAATCTTNALGTCPGDLKAPVKYMKTEFQGMAFVTANGYLDSAGNDVAAEIKEVTFTGAGYRDLHDSVQADPSDSGSKYAYIMAGNYFGSVAACNVFGGYTAVASFINIGTSTIKSNTNTIFFVEKASTTEQVDRNPQNGGTADPDGLSEEETGAPKKRSLCVVYKDDSTCGAEREYPRGAYKFSVFGHFWGTFPTGATSGYPSGTDHVGVRMKLSTVGLNIADLTVNGRKYDAAKAKEAITKLSISGGGETLNFDFPSKYVYGGIGDISASTAVSYDGEKDVKIRVHTLTSDSIMIDYLFETAGLGTGKFFLYDPTVTAGGSVVSVSALLVAVLSLLA